MANKGGSFNKGVVAPELIEERAKCQFNQEELRVFLHGGQEELKAWNYMMNTFGDDPQTRNSIDFYDMTPHEMQENLWKRMKIVYEKHKEPFFENS